VASIEHNPAARALHRRPDLDTMIDQVAPSAAMAGYLKQRVNFSQQRGDYEGAQKVVDQFAAQAGQTQQDISRETNPQVVQARANTAVQVQQAMQKLNPAALQGVLPHLVAPATAAYAKAGQDYAKAVQASNDMQEFLDQARSGNKAAVKIVPLQGALEITTAQGVHRINRTEVDTLGGAGSLYDKVAGAVTGAVTGKNITDSVLDDIGQMQQTVSKNAAQLHANEVQTINRSYGSKFEPMNFGNSAPSAPSSSAAAGFTRVQASDGSVHDIPSGKIAAARQRDPGLKVMQGAAGKSSLLDQVTAAAGR
jgi:hypothetical protein